MTNRSKGILRRLIASFKNNTRLHILRLQGLGIDDDLLKALIEVLASTVVYGVNLGEEEYSDSALNYFVDKLPYT